MGQSSLGVLAVSVLVLACGADPDPGSQTDARADNQGDVDGQDPTEACAEGPISRRCLCAGTAHESGSCCDGVHREQACPGTVAVPVGEMDILYYGSSYGFERSYGVADDQKILATYLAYLDSKGTVVDPYLFDSFLLLDVSTLLEPSPESWGKFLDDTFATKVSPQPARRVSSDDLGKPLGVAPTSQSQNACVAQSVSVADVAGNVSWTAQFAVRAEVPYAGLEALFALKVTDASGASITTGLTGDLAYSAYVDGWYSYVPASKDWRYRTLSFKLPPGAATLSYRLCAWTGNGGDVMFDRAQLVAAATPLSFAELSRAGFDTRIKDGDFNDPATYWSGFKQVTGMERVGRMRAGSGSLVQGPLAVRGGKTYTLGVWAQADAPCPPASCSKNNVLLGLRVYDQAGVEITGDAGLAQTLAYSPNTHPPMWYAYGSASDVWGPLTTAFTLPAQAQKVEVFLYGWTTNAKFDLAQLVESTVPLGAAQLAAAGYETLLLDGSFEDPPQSMRWRHGAPRLLPSGSGVVPALAAAARALGDPRQRNIVVALYPAAPSTRLKDFVIEGLSLDLTRPTDRALAYRWYIEEVLRRWRKTDTRGLALKGFYWAVEDLGEDEIVVRAVRDAVVDNELELFGSPYHIRRVRDDGSCEHLASYPMKIAAYFDHVSIQPGVWPAGAHAGGQAGYDAVPPSCFCQPWTLQDFLDRGQPLCTLAQAQDIADAYQVHVDQEVPGRTRISNEIEWVLGAEAGEQRGRVEAYLNLNPTCQGFDCKGVGWKGPLAHDFGKTPEHLYYHEGTLAAFAFSADPVLRRQYEAVRTFIEQTRVRHSFPSR